MDELRFQELEKKKMEVGLTAEEANELGRMMAEREGKPYSSAEERADEGEPAPDASRSSGEAETGGTKRPREEPGVTPEDEARETAG
jgi:hypothetical protein